VTHDLIYGQSRLFQNRAEENHIFDFTVAALLAILFSWLLYGRNTLKAGQPDPLKKPLGFLYTGM